MKQEFYNDLEELLSWHRILVATTDDIKRGILHGSILGATGLYCFGATGATLGFASGLLFNVYNSPSYSSWKKFLTKRVPSAVVQKKKFSFDWRSGAIITGSLLAGLLLSKKNIKGFFDFSSLYNAKLAWSMRSQMANPIYKEFFASTIKNVAGLGWKLSWISYMVFQANKMLSDGSLPFISKNAKQVASSLGTFFQSPTKRIKTYTHLAQERSPDALFLFQKFLLEQGKKKEALATVLTYYFRKDLAPSIPYSSHRLKKEFLRFELQHKPPLDLFVASLLLPVDKSLTQYYASLAVTDAKEKKDVAELALLATYQSSVNTASADTTWKHVAFLTKNNSSLEEKVLGEGNSGGASQILFEGVQDDPLRWSLVTTKGDKKLLLGKYDLGKAIFPQTEGKKVFPTPKMIALYNKGEEYQLFRQQLWGIPLHDFLAKNASETFVTKDSFFSEILDGITSLQTIYEQQDAVSFQEINWTEKFFSAKNNFYDVRSLEQSLDWMLSSDNKVQGLQKTPLVDPFVGNIGVHKQSDDTVVFPFWDVEPKGIAPRVYDYATFLLTLKPYLHPATYTVLRNKVLSLGLSTSASDYTASFLQSQKAYAGALTLRSLSLLKAWSNEHKQSGMLSARSTLVDSVITEFEYVKRQSDVSLANFAVTNQHLFSNLKEQLSVLSERFTT